MPLSGFPVVSRLIILLCGFVFEDPKQSKNNDTFFCYEFCKKLSDENEKKRVLLFIYSIRYTCIFVNHKRLENNYAIMVYISALSVPLTISPLWLP